MKKANEIIDHILNPYSEKLEIHRCLKKIIALLPKNYNKYITSANLKGEILFINVSHPALRQEIYYKKDLIFSIIKTLHSAGMCKDLNPKKVVTNYKYTPKSKPPKIQKFFIHKAGDFEIRAKDEKIKALFEEIRELLKRN